MPCWFMGPPGCPATLAGLRVRAGGEEQEIPHRGRANVGKYVVLVQENEQGGCHGGHWILLAVARQL